MPGWYIHMDVARKAISSLSSNSGASTLLSSGGPTSSDIINIVNDPANAAYVALGAIGPDLFFLLPDFGAGIQQNLFSAAQTIKDIYTTLDDIFIGPYSDQMTAIDLNSTDINNQFGAGFPQIYADTLRFVNQFLIDAKLVLLTRQMDIFGLLGSGVPKGCDEQAFFWSDMLHYRKTYEFAAALWKNAMGNPRFKAFALGWMSHLATDVAGHCFVNEKCGGPYRLHWQRHHLVENHMDAKVYDSEHGGDAIYQMLSCSALHLWIAFNPDGSSHVNFFNNQPGPTYMDEDTTPAILDRKGKWDFDSDMPDDLAQFVADTLRDVYNPTVVAGPKGQCSQHPLNIANIVNGSDGFPTKDNIVTTYWYLYHYVKMTTTDFYKMRKPDPPSEFATIISPSPPGTGAADDGPGASPSFLHNVFEIIFEILAWIEFLFQTAEAWVANAWASFTFPLTYKVREFLYETIELPVYNAWAALHWYLSMTGFVSPMTDEINPALTTLGLGTDGVWQTILNAIGDPVGGLNSIMSGGGPAGGLNIPPTMLEPSGSDLDNTYPHDVVVDPMSALNATHIDPSNLTSSSLDPTGVLTSLIVNHLIKPCKKEGDTAGEIPSEFLRPWLWPSNDNTGDIVPSETTINAPASPYKSMQDVTALMGNVPGNVTARNHFESATNESDTIQYIQQHLPHGEYLGDPIDYTAYVIAWLTRDNPQNIANFNLDSDRGYGYLCWDWVRSKDKALTAILDKYKGQPNECRYRAPLHPGAGWCENDIDPNANLPPMGSPDRPSVYDGDMTKPVRIRYIDREDKFA